MSSVRPGNPGATRQCPHCRETVLESAAGCPACRHYLRVDVGVEAPQPPALTPLRIEGSIRHPADGEPWEYNVVVSIRDDRGVEIARRLIGVGAMNPDEQRTFALSVEVLSTTAKSPGKGGVRHWRANLAALAARPPAGKTLAEVGEVVGRIHRHFLQHELKSLDVMERTLGGLEE